jgi:serine/threonine protein kinase
MSSREGRTARTRRNLADPRPPGGATQPTVSPPGATRATLPVPGATHATRRRPADFPPAPVVLDRYRLQRRLGAGAFGTVWMAHDERLGRDVAVKILARERVVGGRFEREARAAARLSHPAIVTLYEATVDDEGAYLVSELVIGATLHTLLQEGRLSDRDIVSVGIGLCDALQHAHAQGVVHRDVKPSNVLVPDAPVSAAQVAKLTDFGVARVIGGDALTMTGDVLGTLAYMAPEQAEGLEVGASADLYSLALVLYEALSGVNPVARSGAPSRSRRLGTYLPPLRRQRRDLPRELGQGIDMALRPRPRERGTVAELHRALTLAQARVGDEPGIVTGAWPAPRPRAAADAWGPAPPDGPPDALPAPHTDLRHRARHPDPRLAPAAGEEPATAAPAPAWPPRGLAGAAAAGLTAWLAVGALAPAPVPAPAAALVAGGAVLLLPRLGWMALTAALAVAAISQHLDGAALVILIALLLPVLALPGRPTAWPLPAGAPALGLIGLGGAWPAVAAQAATSWRRAWLGAIGWVWLLLAGSLAGQVLYLPHVPGTPGPRHWTGSLGETVHHLLATLVSTGVLAPAAVWAVAAVVLPWLISGRSIALDVVRVVAWAAALVWATGAAIIAVHGSDQLGAAPDALIGAVASAAVALAPSSLRMWRQALHGGGPEARVP